MSAPDSLQHLGSSRVGARSGGALSGRTLRPNALFEELLDVARRMFDDVRRDEGQFQTGMCIVKGKKVVVVNIRQSLEERITGLARVIARFGAENQYLKPAVRVEVERYSPREDAGGSN